MQITNNNSDMKKRFLKIFSIVLASVVLISVTAGVIGVSVWKKSDDYVKFDRNRLNEVYTSLTILDNDGAKIAEPMYLYEYKQIPLDALHDYTYKAFVAVEDKRFFSHKGIDYKRVFGAMLHNLKSGGYKEGASTISQQLIKNTHLDNYKTMKRKANEMLLARELEKNYTKKEILEMYLNTIYFGRNAYGIETASNVYFNKSAQDLTVSESAVLAGMIKAPNTYAPDKNADKCKIRRDSVLKLMREQQVIDSEQYNRALESEIEYVPQKVRAEKSYTYHVMKEACRLLNMTPMQLAQSNFIIETYCNQSKQRALSNLVKSDKTVTKSGALADISAIVTDSCGGVEACYFRGATAGDRRQVGSAFKPIAVYAPALNERIITEASPVLDELTDFNGYKPSNAGGYSGWTTIKNSVAKSLNVPAVKTLNALGLDKAQGYLEKLGIQGEQNLSMALGNVNGGVDLFTLAKGYSTLANDGVCNDVCFIKSICNENGTIYSRRTENVRVFQPSANYLMTDMLVNTVQNGTAKRRKRDGYQVAAKTGTVGNSQGNSDAIIAGYTTSDVFAVWFSGDLDNDVSGSTAPSVLAGKLLDKMYEKVKPAKFVRPSNIIEVELDAESLYDDQKVLIADGGEKFLFDACNAPQERAEKPTYTYELTGKAVDDSVTVELPQTDKGRWILYKKTDDGKTECTAPNGRYTETLKADRAEYFAELIVNDKTVYTTPVLTVCRAKPQDKNEFPSIIDFWYWK